MALNDENGGGGGIPATMLVGPANLNGGQAMPYYPFPMMMGGGQGGGNGMFGGDGSWIILLIIVLLAAGGGWGNNFGGNGGGGFGGAPIVINDGGNGGGAVQRGFDQAAVMTGVGAIQSGISALSTQLCGCCCDMQNTVNQGFAGVNANMSNGFAQAEISNNARQIADMQQNFAAQIATMQGFNSLQNQLSTCCCDNRAGLADVRYTIATEECATRNNSTQNTRDIIDSQTRGTQAILDKLCALELDNYKRENDALRTQLNMASLAASQTAQTAQIREGQLATMNNLVSELRSCPIPSQPVYGTQAIFTCPNNNNNGCGCGCGMA